MRCAYCHSEFEAEEPQRCPGCQTLLHAECAAAIPACPTLGCHTPLGGARPVKRSRPPPGRLRYVAWILFGILAPLVAFGVDAALRVDPLIWVRPQFLPEPEGLKGVSLRQVLMYLGVLASMVGVVQFLRGRKGPALPFLAWGVVLSAAHALVFIPLLPLSLLGIIMMGMGLLGLIPYATYYVFYDLYRRAREDLRQDAEYRDHFLVSDGPRILRRFVLVGATLGLVALCLLTPSPHRFAAPAARHLEGVDLDELRVASAALMTRAEGPLEAASLPAALADLAEGGSVTVGPDWVEVLWRGSAQKSQAYPYGYTLIVLAEGRELPPAPGTCYRCVEIAPGVWSRYLVKGEPAGGGPVFQRAE